MHYARTADLEGWEGYGEMMRWRVEYGVKGLIVGTEERESEREVEMYLESVLVKFEFFSKHLTFWMCTYI